ncbi:hypothetical protein NHQ30_003021 [Ciborinia camelliae]|nr:hypothetical protein NHQ30_003021 [Ciborinia camelliae]
MRVVDGVDGHGEEEAQGQGTSRSRSQGREYGDDDGELSMSQVLGSLKRKKGGGEGGGEDYFSTSTALRAVEVIYGEWGWECGDDAGCYEGVPAQPLSLSDIVGAVEVGDGRVSRGGNENATNSPERSPGWKYGHGNLKREGWVKEMIVELE